MCRPCMSNSVQLFLNMNDVVSTFSANSYCFYVIICGFVLTNSRSLWLFWVNLLIDALVLSLLLLQHYFKLKMENRERTKSCPLHCVTEKEALHTVSETVPRPNFDPYKHFSAHMSAKSPIKISLNPSAVICEVSESYQHDHYCPGPRNSQGNLADPIPCITRSKKIIDTLILDFCCPVASI